MMQLGSIRGHVNNFDVLVLSVLLALGLATVLVLLRGDRVGVQVNEMVPAPESTGVSTRTEIRLTFDELMDKLSVERRFRVAPAVEGVLSWRGNTLIWRPRDPLAMNTHYVIKLAAGAQSAQGRTLRDDLTWTFHTGHPRVLYMSVGDVSQLYEVDTNVSSVRQLTRFEDGSSIWDYTVSPDGSQIAFGLVRPDASAVDLGLMNADGSDAQRLLTCDDSQCTGAAWSPDGRRLAYERRELNVDLGAVGGGLGPSRVWLYDLSSGVTRRLFQDSQMLGYAPRWSPDGRRLAYFDPLGGVRVLDLDGVDVGASQLIPNQLGEIGTWSPDGRALALVDLAFEGESYTSYLVRADLDDSATYNLSGAEAEVNDGSPAWSPTDEWIAFGRKAAADGTPTPGQQLWLMRPDGSQVHSLVTDSDAHLGSIAWSPDGRDIAYLRFPLMQANARPEIWLVSIDGGEPVKLADSGTLPKWVP
jgi:TolB protein